MTYTQTQDGRIKIVYTGNFTFVKIDSELPSGSSYILDGPENHKLIAIERVSTLTLDEAFKLGEAKYKEQNKS